MPRNGGPFRIVPRSHTSAKLVESPTMLQTSQKVAADYGLIVESARFSFDRSRQHIGIRQHGIQF